MQRWTKVFAAAGLAVLVGSMANPVLAQQQRGRGGPGGFGGGGMMGGGRQVSVFSLLRSEEVQKDIKITDDQKTKAMKLGEELAAAVREVQPEFNRDGSREEYAKKMEEARPKMEKLMAEKKTALAAVLSADQMKRLDEIVLQVKGGDALNEAELQSKLMVTDEQKAKLANVTKESGEKMRSAFGGGGGGGFDREKMAAVQKERSDALVAVLTPAQAEQYDMMKGKAVADLEAIRRGMGGGRGPGGPGGGGPGGGRGGDRPNRPATEN